MNTHTTGCDHQRIDDFLNSDPVALDDAQLLDHLDACAACRQYMEMQAAEPEYWRKATELLQSTEFDHARSSECSAASIGHLRISHSVAIRNVLDSLAPSDDPDRLGRLGGYEVSGVVGVGGMGVVLKALDRVVAAKQAGVTKIVYTSVQGAEEKTAFSPIVQSNRQTEEDIRNSGLDWVIGRNGIYIEPDVEFIETYKKTR